MLAMGRNGGRERNGKIHLYYSNLRQVIFWRRSELFDLRLLFIMLNNQQVAKVLLCSKLIQNIAKLHQIFYISSLEFSSRNKKMLTVNMNVNVKRPCRVTPPKEMAVAAWLYYYGNVHVNGQHFISESSFWHVVNWIP